MPEYVILDNEITSDITVTSSDDIQPIQIEVQVVPLLIAELDIHFLSPQFEYDIEIPVATIQDKGLIYRGLIRDNLMINAKAPYGSLETDAVWTVITSTLSPIGEVISTTIAENQIWSNYNN